MDYLSVKEVAELKGCSVQYIKKCCKEGKIKAEMMPHSQNGCMCYKIPVSALNEEEQAKYYRKIKKESGFIPYSESSENSVKTGLKYNLKTAERTFESFSEKEREQIAARTELLLRWQTERNAHQGSKTKFDKTFAAAMAYKCGINLSPDILYRQYAAYKAGCLEALLDSRGAWNRGKSKLDDDDEIWKVFLQIYLDDSGKKLAECYREMLAYFHEEKPELLESVPSIDTFRRKAKKIPFAVIEYTRNGAKAMHDHCLPYIQRMKDGIHANSVWVMDNYTFDILCQNEEGVTATKRFYLTGALDAKSGVLVGWNVSDSSDSQSTVIALRNAMNRCGIPEWLYFDNGREFTPKDLSGSRGARKMADIPIPPYILSRLGVKVKFAIAHNAQSKDIERAHLTFKNQFCRGFEGWCGGNILERPESLKRKIKGGVIETEHELRERFSEYADYVYNVQQYGGEETKYQGMSRIDVWNKSIADVGMRYADSETLNLLLMRTTGYQKISREGVFINFQGEKIYYYDEDAWYHIGEEVYVRYDPCDLRNVRIYDKEDRYLWTWGLADALILEYINADSEAIAEAQRIKGNTARAIKERAAELQGKPKIRRRDGMRYTIAKNKNNFKICIPDKIYPVSADEPIAKAAGAENLDFTETGNIIEVENYRSELEEIRAMNDRLENMKGV